MLLHRRLRLRPRTTRWSRLPDLPYCVTAGQGHPTQDGLLVLGGDKNLDRWNQIQHQTALRDAAPKASPTWNHHNEVITWIYDHHTGFNLEILRFKANRWILHDHSRGPSQVTTPTAWHLRT